MVLDACLWPSTAVCTGSLHIHARTNAHTHAGTNAHSGVGAQTERREKA